VTRALFVCAILIIIGDVASYDDGYAAATLPVAPAQQARKADASHKRGICQKIAKDVDLLLYEDPQLHGKTTTCSYTDDRLLIKPNSSLNRDRMARFKFLSFSAVGFLANEDFTLPPKVYVGYGTVCQVMTTAQAAKLQSAAKYDGALGMNAAMAMTASADKVECPK
jgi:hypothetical protein